MSAITNQVRQLLKLTESGHGYWLINHYEAIEDYLHALVNIYGVMTAKELIDNPNTEAHKNIYSLIEEARA